jgi:CheY-like chemotaxis protein
MSTEKKIICVIEDNKPVRKLFTTLLAKSGYSVFDFETGNEAIDWLKNNQPDIILSDILLPDTSGKEVLIAIRELPYGKTVPVIAITGFAHASDRQKYLDLGFDAYIPKPINTVTFVKEVQDIIIEKLSN